MFSSPLKSSMISPNPQKSNKTKPISSQANLKLTWFMKKEKLNKVNKNNANPANIQNVNPKNTNQMRSKRKRMKRRKITTFSQRNSHWVKDLSKHKDTKSQLSYEKAIIKLKKSQLHILWRMIKCRPLIVC